nr:hypothetical protein [Actinomadura oligospora]
MAVVMAVTFVVADQAVRPSAAAAPNPVAPANLALATGYNFNGQLGDGTTTTRNIPGPVVLPEGVTLTNIDAGHHHNLAVTSGGQVLGWGQNAYGELGNGSTSGIVHIPVQAALPSGATVTQVSGGYHYSLAVTSDGRVLAWGQNTQGQLGDGTTTHRDTPVEVILPDYVTVTQITAGRYHSAMLADQPTSSTSLTADPTHAAPCQEVTLTATVTCSEGDPSGTRHLLERRPADRRRRPRRERHRDPDHHRPGRGPAPHHRPLRGRHCPPSTSGPVTVTIAAEPPTPACT